MPLQVIVIGAGTGGAAAATALAKQGHTVTIYEREDSTTEVGFAFRITANSVRCLKHLNIDPEKGGATQANTSRIHDKDGNITAEKRENADAEQAKEAASVFASRPKLTAQQINEAVACGVKIKNGIKIKSVDTEGTAVALEDDTRASADLIVAADGIHSVVRHHIIDTSTYKPKPTLSRNCFRFNIPTSAIDKDEVLSKLFSKDFRFNSWFGDKKALIAYPINFDQEYAFACIHPAELSDNAAIQNEAEAVSYNKRVSVETVKEIYSEFEARVHRLIDLADPDGFRIWKLQDMDDIPNWSVNRTVLIGDAAHPVLPYGFSGASMAMEDAVTLAELLPEDVKVEEIPSRLQLLEKIRKPRVTRVREHARATGRGETSTEEQTEYMDYICGHDAVQTAREALKGLQTKQ